MVRLQLATRYKLSSFLGLRQAEECDLTVPAGSDEPKASLGRKKGYIGDFLVNVECLVDRLVEDDTATVYVEYLNNAALERNQQELLRWVNRHELNLVLVRKSLHRSVILRH